MTNLILKLESEFNEDYFETCFHSSLPYVRQNLNWDDYGIENEQGKSWIMYRYREAFNDPKQIVFSVKRKNRILGYFLGVLDNDKQALLLEYVLYNTDENGSRSWVYDFYGSEALKQVLSKIGMERWYIKVYAENGDKTSHYSGIPDGEPTGEYGNKTRNYRIFKSPYGW